MSNDAISIIISQPPSEETYSHEFVRKIRHNLGYKFLPPVERFPLNETQAAKRLEFTNHHISVGTNWDSVIFVDESMFIKDSNSRWVWRKRSDDNPLIYNESSKFPTKVMVFGGISKLWRTPLISIEGTVDANTYVDECIEETG